ncbi:MAG: hypothetical protein AAGK02_00025 [Pseudomonadota bacterium]
MDPYSNLKNDDILLRVLRLSDLGHTSEDIAEALRLPRDLVRSMVFDAAPNDFNEQERIQ